jgi:acetoin utilization deacetylase AcuC-like enzyme/GNAT superfamily N-acetyltransferase
MFRIRRVFDSLTSVNKEAVSQVQGILRTQFSGLSEKEITELPKKLHNPLKYRFRSILFVADDEKERVKGFALLFHGPTLNFCYLDYISTATKLDGRGIGGALYARVREEALSLKTIGVFFECLPDDPELSRNPVVRKQNAARLRFYERFGARPIINTAYETPLKPGDDNPPYLVYDNLNRDAPLSRDEARAVVRAILERKYGRLCPEGYIDMVVASFRDDPVRLRLPKYVGDSPAATLKHSIPVDERIVLLLNTKHNIHHIQEVGYVEAPVRIDTILKEIDGTGMFRTVPSESFTEKYVRSVHDAAYVNYFKRACATLEPERSIYPYVFPIRNAAKPPKELAVRAGYYCIDTFTPLNRNAYLAAKGAVDCALTGAGEIIAGEQLVYALVRPPGHHAERHSFGGFCYFNSAAIAAQYLSNYGRVTMLDVDYHHGNGQQDIFYDRSDVLTISIHGHPGFAYPYFSGFKDERGTGVGEGYNVNYPMPEKLDGEGYRKVLEKALRRITRFRPRFLVVLLGLDTAEGDPTGTWSLQPADFEVNGEMIGSLGLPTLVVQEGGYDTRFLGINARHFFTGLWSGMYSR